jgi:small subunit ribosomal protein S18
MGHRPFPRVICHRLGVGSCVQKSPQLPSTKHLAADGGIVTIQGSRGRALKPTSTRRVVKKDPICVDGVRPRPMFIDYKDLDLLSKLTNRHGRIVSRRKTGCHASSQHAVAKAIKRARFMALMPYIGG